MIQPKIFKIDIYTTNILYATRNEIEGTIFNDLMSQLHTANDNDDVINAYKYALDDVSGGEEFVDDVIAEAMSQVREKFLLRDHFQGKLEIEINVNDTNVHFQQFKIVLFNYTQRDYNRLYVGYIQSKFSLLFENPSQDGIDKYDYVYERALPFAWRFDD